MINNLSPTFKGIYSVKFDYANETQGYRDSLGHVDGVSTEAGRAKNEVIVKTPNPQWSEKDRFLVTNSDLLTTKQIVQINNSFKENRKALKI